MITLPDSLQAAALAQGHAPRTLVEVATVEGTYRFAEEAIRWSGYDYSPRLQNPAEVSASLDGSADGTVPSGNTSIVLANPDGFVSRKRCWQGAAATVREVFLGVDSVSVRTTRFTVTGVNADRANATLSCDDVLGAATDAPVPPREHTITLERWPNVDVGGNAIGQAVPRVYGECYAPLFLVDQRSTPGDRYVACTDTASLRGMVVERWDGGFSPVTASSFFADTWSATAATRGGLAVFEVELAPLIPNLGAVRFAHLTSPLGAFVTPAQVFADVMTLAGMGHLVDSDANLAAHTAYLANSHACDASLTGVVGLRPLLGALAHDGLCRFRLGDTLALIPVASSAPVGSFYPGNILAGTLAIEDVPLRDIASDRVVFYRDRTTDPAIQSFRRAAVGSGAQTATEAVFLGRPSVVQRVAGTWAALEYHGRRRYRFQTPMTATALEAGDPVTFTHSLAGVDGVRCEVLAARRAGESIAWTLREQPIEAFAVPNLPADPAFEILYQRLPYTGASWSLTDVPPFTVTVSHRLARAPDSVRTVTNLGVWGFTVQASLTAATTTTATIRTAVVGGGPFQLADTLLAWDLRCPTANPAF